MGESSTEPESRDDAALISAVASGDAEAYVLLHERHVAAARSLAGLVAQADQAEEVLSAAFARLHDLLRDGGGPQVALRPFLLTEVRRAAGQDVEGAEAADAELAGSLLARAFTGVPEPQRAALWHVVIEQSDPVQTAAILGVPADGVAELAANASAAYVQAYLKLYEAGLAREDCREAVGGLDHGADGAPSSLDQFATLPHLRACRECRAAAIELADLSRSLCGWVAPVYLSVKATPGYLAAVRVKAGKKPPAAGRAAALSPARRRRTGESPRGGTRAAPRRSREASRRPIHAPRPAVLPSSPAEHALPPSPAEHALPPSAAEHAEPSPAPAERAVPPWEVADFVPPVFAAESVEHAEYAEAPERVAGPSRSATAPRRAGQARGLVRNASRQQRALAAAGLVVVAFAGTGLALTLASSNGPARQSPAQRPAPAAIAPPSSGPAPSSAAPSSPAHKRARPTAQPTPSKAAPRPPKPSATASPTPSPVATPPPVQDPFPHHHHHHPPL